MATSALGRGCAETPLQKRYGASIDASTVALRGLRVYDLALESWIHRVNKEAFLQTFEAN
jgi:hypothetical protein